MARLYVEGPAAAGESPRMTVARMMRALDDQAAVEGHRVAGDVTIMEYPRSALALTATYRLEADVVPAV